MSNPLLALPEVKEDTLARCVADHLDDSLAYTTGMGWMVWTGQRWERDPEATASMRILSDWLRPLVLDAIAHSPSSEASGYRNLLNLRPQEHVLRMARGRMAVPIEDWDADPRLLNTPTGVVDLDTGDVLPHRAWRRMTRITAVGYRAGASHPDWDRALQCQPDDDSRAWMKWYLGSGCWGRQPGDILGMLTGEGANGKSTVTGACVAALGDYATPVDRSVIIGGGHEAHRAALVGRRLGLVEELAQDHRLNMAEVKGLLGTEEITGRFLYKEQITFPTQFTLAVTTNHRPGVPETDHGTWRRLKRLHFPVKYEGADLDPHLRYRLRTFQAQQEAVLAWLVDGARMADPGESLEMATAKEEWREEADSLVTFIADHLEADPSGFTSTATLLEVFNRDREEAKEKPWSARLFVQRFTTHPRLPAGVTYGRQGGRGPRGFHGVGLRAGVVPW